MMRGLLGAGHAFLLRGVNKSDSPGETHRGAVRVAWLGSSPLSSTDARSASRLPESWLTAGLSEAIEFGVAVDSRDLVARGLRRPRLTLAA